MEIFNSSSVTQTLANAMSGFNHPIQQGRQQSKALKQFLWHSRKEEIWVLGVVWGKAFWTLIQTPWLMTHHIPKSGMVQLELVLIGHTKQKSLVPMVLLILGLKLEWQRCTSMFWHNISISLILRRNKGNKKNYPGGGLFYSLELDTEVTSPTTRSWELLSWSGV